MDFRTPVALAAPSFLIAPQERMLFVGSCFADRLGRRFVADKFRATVNPFGVMYNPASILHTVRRYEGEAPRVTVITLGTSHVYILKETGEIVDNCQKRPQRLFREEELSVGDCADCLSEAVGLLVNRREDARVIVTVSPIRYAKYGFHGSRLSKATLLLAADRLVRRWPGTVEYFPAYEIVCDELRDYRFYAPDMIHPSEQAVDYVWERFSSVYFSPATRQFLEEWKPIREALSHRPFHPESDAYKTFLERTCERARLLAARYPDLDLSDEINLCQNI